PPRPSSCASTLDVIDALLSWERHTGSEEGTRARRLGEEYLLRCHLFRSLRTGEEGNPQWELISHPPALGLRPAQGHGVLRPAWGHSGCAAGRSDQTRSAPSAD